MSAHTPGPWGLAEIVENKFSRTDMRRVRSAKEGLEHGAVCEVYGVRDGSVAAANARLIAAAPELLAVLQEIVGYSGGAQTALDDEYVMERAAAALAKATGAQP